MKTEIQKCSEDILYFKEKYLGLQKDKIQDEILRLLQKNKRLNIETGRNSKKTTAAAIYILHNFLFEEEFNAGIISHSLVYSKDILAKIVNLYNQLPNEFKTKVKITKTSFYNESNKSKVIVDNIDDKTFIGFNIDFILLDNAAVIQKTKLKLFFDYIIKTFETSQILINDDIQIKTYAPNFAEWDGSFNETFKDEEPKKVKRPIKNAGFKQFIKNIIEKLFNIIKR